MLLNSEQVIHFLSNHSENSLQQVSVDLRLREVKKVKGGKIFRDSKEINPYIYLPTERLTPEKKGWLLLPGVYSVTFYEDCIIPEDKTGMILHKSSLVRIGGCLDCGIYDPGYKSEGGMGAILTVSSVIEIEEGSKIGTFYMFQNSPVSKDLLYNGEYQGEKDIK